MKILYDHQAFSMQDYGGVSRYFLELANEFNHYKDVEVEYPRMISNNEYLEKNSLIEAQFFLKGVKFKGKGTILSYLKKMNPRWSSGAIEKSNFDLFHPTYYDPYFLKEKISKPVVMTCYDLIHEKFKQFDTETLDWKKKSLSAASHILAISENTKIDLMEYYGIPDEKITVTYLATSFKSAVTDSAESRPYFLYVGTRSENYKNFIPFIKSIAPLLLQHKDLMLYCAGSKPFTKEEWTLFADLKLADKVRHYSGSNESLIKLYSNSLAFFYPSLYEGFGIPLLEAMNCGCPVLCSNRSSLPEVAGDAAVYFDPLNNESMLNAAEKIVENSTLRESLRKKGFNRANAFSWKKTAMDTYNSYKSLL